MAGRGTRAKAPAPPEKAPPRAASAAASGRAAAAPASGRAAAGAAAASPGKSRKGGAAPTDDARKEALAEAEGMAQAVANDDDGIKDKSASPPPAGRKSDRAGILERQKEKAERDRLLAETERLRKELDAYTVRESKRKQSEAAEKAPPAKRAAGSGRRSASAPQVRCLPGLLCIVFHSSGSFETRLCNGGVGDPPHHNTMGM